MPIQRWRWDQGRKLYFEFPALKAAAALFVALNGTTRTIAPDPFRPGLAAATKLSFGTGKGARYDVWRNYGRIYRAALLAVLQKDVLHVTDLCRAIASTWGVDEFLSFLARRFYMPSSALLSGYAPSRSRVWPIAVVLRYLAARGSLNSTDALRVLVANGCVGDEPLSYYLSLKPRSYKAAKDETRQVREFLEFISQFSFLTWDDAAHTIRLRPGTSPKLLTNIAVPDPSAQLKNSAAEIIRLGTVPGWYVSPATGMLAVGAAQSVAIPLDEEDREFAEGNRYAQQHLRLERDSRLRKAFFDAQTVPVSCDICGLSPKARYPWIDPGDALIEVHHRLPLSSTVYAGKTAIADLSPLCPSCHKAVHKYYSVWLSGMGLDDFSAAAEADAVYQEAKAKFESGKGTA